MSWLPPNVHVSKHPCLIAKMSQLRSKSTTSKETEQLVHDISVMLGLEALAGLTLIEGQPAMGYFCERRKYRVDASTSGVRKGGKYKSLVEMAIKAVIQSDETPIGATYTPQTIQTSSLTLIPILRSGLAMVSAIQSLLPSPISVHHLGLYREKATLQPVEYYNNLPQSSSGSSSSSNNNNTTTTPTTAILVDPVLATGGTAIAAIQTLREWGVQRIIVVNVIAAREGLGRAAEEWRDATEFWVGAVDEELTGTGMIKPGLGDVGDRLFGTIGK